MIFLKWTKNPDKWTKEQNIDNNAQCILEMALTEHRYQEKEEEEDLLAIRIA